jgi:hypothetical protein
VYNCDVTKTFFGLGVVGAAVGLLEGAALGFAVGLLVDCPTLGTEVGVEVFGAVLQGKKVKEADGSELGWKVGAMLGDSLGARVGVAEVSRLGWKVGDMVGRKVGIPVGAAVGLTLLVAVGAGVVDCATGDMLGADAVGLGLLGADAVGLGVLGADAVRLGVEEFSPWVPSTAVHVPHFQPKRRLIAGRKAQVSSQAPSVP